jgi:hypothetical protein
MFPGEVLQTAESRIRDRGDRKKRILAKPCPGSLQMRESRFQDRKTRKQTILTSLALFSADEKKQISRQGDRRQKILTKLALLPAEVL